MKAVNSANRVRTLMLPARFDSETAFVVEQDVRTALVPGAQLILDGSAVTYMSAAGVRTLASVLHAAQAVSAEVVFCRFKGAAADCLEVSGFSQLLDVADSLDQAMARLGADGQTRSVGRLHVRGAAG